MLWTNRNEPAKALPFLRDAEGIYKSGGGGSGGEGRTKKEEDGHTQTLFYLAQILGSMGQEDESASMCGACLRRQLESGDFTPDEWAQNTAQMAGFYVSKACWATARHCIAAADQVGRCTRSLFSST
jgi:hypothetical protein